MKETDSTRPEVGAKSAEIIAAKVLTGFQARTVLGPGELTFDEKLATGIKQGWEPQGGIAVAYAGESSYPLYSVLVVRRAS